MRTSKSLIVIIIFYFVITIIYIAITTRYEIILKYHKYYIPFMISYNDLGIGFNITNGGFTIQEVTVFIPGSFTMLSLNIENKIDEKSFFEPKIINPKHKKKVGDFEIIPGVGAYGILLGSEKKTIRYICEKLTDEQFNQISYFDCNLGKSRKMWIFINDKKISNLILHSKFVTPEGITQNSGITDIIKTYGEPDNILYINNIPIVRRIVPIIIIPILGIIAGLLIKNLRNNILNNRKRILSSLFLGSVIAIVTSLLSNVISNDFYQNNLDSSYHYLILLSINTLLSGIISIIILEILIDYMNSLVRHISVLIVMLFGMIISNWLISILWIYHPIPFFYLLPIMISNAVFIIFLFLSNIRFVKQM